MAQPRRLAVPMEHSCPQKVYLQEHQQVRSEGAPKLVSPVTCHGTSFYRKFGKGGNKFVVHPQSIVPPGGRKAHAARTFSQLCCNIQFLTMVTRHCLVVGVRLAVPSLWRDRTKRVRQAVPLQPAGQEPAPPEKPQTRSAGPALQARKFLFFWQEICAICGITRIRNGCSLGCGSAALRYLLNAPWLCPSCWLQYYPRHRAAT
jgi:hypothetical protein